MLVTENSALETKTRHRLHYEGTGRRNNYQKKKKSRWTINKTYIFAGCKHILSNVTQKERTASQGQNICITGLT